MTGFPQTALKGYIYIATEALVRVAPITAAVSSWFVRVGGVLSLVSSWATSIEPSSR